MNDSEALELIDAHLDHQPLTSEQAEGLNSWLRSDPKNADQAFHRIFLHTYLRRRLQTGALSGEFAAAIEDAERADEIGELVTLPAPALQTLPAPIEPLATTAGRSKWITRWAGRLAACIVIAAFIGLLSIPPSPNRGALCTYEGFDYPPTQHDVPPRDAQEWPTTGGLQDLNGGQGWAGGWQESGSKVAIVLEDTEGAAWGRKDMRKFGTLGYSDRLGHVLKSTGIQMRTAAGRTCLTTRQLDLSAYPASMIDEDGIGRDGTVLWFSFLVQSFDSDGMGRFAFVQLGTKQAGFRVGKLASVPSGNWSAAGLFDQAEVNLRSSAVPSGEAAFIVVRFTFRPGPEQVEVWINPRLDLEPTPAETTMRLAIPDVRFKELMITSRYSTDLDEIRIGNTFQSVAPIR